jgi:RNA chaperone Hfq
MLDAYMAAQTPVTMTLQNSVRVSGKIKAFDSYVIVMENHKREIVYRHAVSSIFAATLPEPKTRPAAVKPAALKAVPSQPGKAASRRPKATPKLPLAASGLDQDLTNTMKDGLLKWMQEQKAAK